MRKLFTCTALLMMAFICRANAQTNCLIARDASWSVMPTSDDGSVGPLTLPFTFNLYGTPYTQVWINNNGNLTFNGSYSGYNAAPYPIANQPMVAAYWDDEDTRSCGNVYYKFFGTRLVVSYENVGYYSQNCGLHNTFQIVIGTTSDPVIGAGQNVLFNYGTMQWASAYSGSAATVGINAGTNNNYVQVGQFGLLSNAYDGGGGAVDGVYYLNNKCFGFNASSDGNIPPSFTGLPNNNTFNVTCGQTANYTINAIGPEVNQTVTSVVNTNGLCGVTSSVTNGAVSTINLSFTGSACNVGTNTITVTATDNGTPAATTTATFTVNVTTSGTAPTVTAGGPTSFCQGGSVALTSSAASSYQWYNNGSAIPGATSQSYTATTAGSYTVITTTSGGCNSPSAATQVTISPLPLFTAVPANTSVSASAGNCSAAVSYTATATDANSYSYTFSGATTGSGSGTGSGATFNKGTTNVTVNATNACGNATTPATFTVTVTDNQAPTIASLPANISVNNTPGACGAVVNWAAPVALDNCPGAVITQIAGQPNGSAFPVGGPYTITYRATDAVGNNSASQSFTVTVADNELPVITTPANITVNCQDATTIAALGAATAADNCGIQSLTSADVSTKGSNPANASYYNYTITRTWTATDIHGLSATASQVITVHDVTPPALTAPAAAAQCNNGTGNNLTRTASATDACSSPLTYAWTISGATSGSGTGAAVTSNFNVGNSTISWTVTDASGNTSPAATTAVAIYDLPAVSFASTVSPACFGQSNGAITTSITGGTPGYNYIWTPGNVTTANRSNIPAGTYSVAVTDLHGCAAANSITLSQPPVLSGGITTGTFAVPSCPAYNIYLGYGATNDTLTTAITGGTTPYSYAWAPAAGTSILTSKRVVTPAATTTYTATVTDAHGCTTTTAYQVKVLDIHCGPTYIGRERNNTITMCHNGASACVSPATAAGYIILGECMGGCNTASRMAGGSGINDESSLTGAISVYPNPAHGSVNVQLTGIGSYYSAYQVTDLTGKLMAQEIPEAGRVADLVTIDVSKFAPGIYLIRVAGEGGTTAIARFAVQ